MANSPVQIANSALTKIGSKAIQSLDDNGVEAAACRLRLEAVKRIVLRMHPWNCAISRVTLAPLVETPPFGYTYVFQLPSDYLRVLYVSPDSVRYRIEGKKIVSDDSVLQLKYIKDCAIGDLDELTAEAVACYLAWDIAYLITQKDSVREMVWQQFELIKRQAKSVDAQEERDHELTADLFLESRY